MGTRQEQSEVSAVVDEVDALGIDNLTVDLLHDLYRVRAVSRRTRPRGPTRNEFLVTRIQLT
jgi:hypothetical protein